MKKIALVDKCTTPKELFYYFLELLGQFPYHSFLAKWQWEQLDFLLENLTTDRAVCIHDYSDGYACWFQDKIQSQYFHLNKLSLHVTILERHSNEEMDGLQSAGDEPVICKEHLFIISDDVQQGHVSDPHIQKLISRHLKESNCTIKKMHEFKDGCEGRCKSRHCYAHISCSLATFGYTGQRKTTLPPLMQRENKKQLAHMLRRRQHQHFPPELHFQMQKWTTFSNAKDLCDFSKITF